MSSTAVLSLKAYNGETIQIVYDDYGHQYARRVSKDKSSSTNWVSSDAEISRLLHSSIKSKDYSTPNERVTEIESDVKSSTDLLNEVSKKTDHLYDQLKGSLTGLKVNGVVTSSDQLPSDSSNGDVYLVNDLIYIRSAGKWIEGGSYKGPQGDQGLPGPGLNIRGSVSSVNDLPSSGQNGYAYFVGSTMYAWIDTKWVSVGDIAPDLSKYSTTDLMNKSIDEKIANYDSTSFHESDTSNYQKKKVTTDAGQPLAVINSGDDLNSKIKSLSSTTGFGTIFISGSSVGNSLNTDLSGTFISDGNSVIISAITPTLDSVRIKGTPTGDPSWESSHDKVTDNKDGTEQLNGVQVRPFNILTDTVGTRNYIAPYSWISKGQYGFFSSSGGILSGTNSQGDVHSDYIVASSMRMTFTVYQLSTNGAPGVQAFDSNKKWLKGYPILTGGSTGSTAIQFPTGTAYFTTNVPNPVKYGGLYKLENGTVGTDWTPAPEDKVNVADMRKPANDVVGLEDITQAALPDGTDFYTLLNTAGRPLQYFVDGFPHAKTMINKPTSTLSGFILITTAVNNRTVATYNYTFLSLREVVTGNSYEAVITTDGTGKITVTRPWRKLSFDDEVAHLSGANNFDTVPTVNNNPLLLASSLPSDLARTGQDANFTGKLQKSGIDVATKSDVTTAVSTATANMVDSSKPANFTAGLQSGGVDVATAADLKSVADKAWYRLDFGPDANLGGAVVSSYIVYQIHDDEKYISFFYLGVSQSVNKTFMDNTTLMDLSSIVKGISSIDFSVNYSEMSDNSGNAAGFKISGTKIITSTSSHWLYISPNSIVSLHPLNHDERRIYYTELV